MGFGFLIKEVLRNKNMTIKQLAEDSGISVNTLYSITKRDSNRVDPVIISRICEALQITIGDLMGIRPKNETPDNYAALDEGISALFGAGWALAHDVENQIRIALDGFAEFESLEEEMLFYFKRLNDEGQEIALKNIQIIAGNKQYQRTKPPEAPEEEKEGHSSSTDENPPKGL